MAGVLTAFAGAMSPAIADLLLDARSARQSITSICDVAQHPNTNPSCPSESGLNSGAVPFQPTRTTRTLCSDKLQTVFLQTTPAVIYHPCEPRVSLKVRLFLDGGSQNSYISERACVYST